MCTGIGYKLMTSTSWFSFSDNVPEAFSCEGGDSMAAIFFLFLGKKLPKKPELPSFKSNDGLDDLGGTAPGIGLPVLGSITGLLGECRSLTIAIA